MAMDDIKLDQLTLDELKDVKGGIPYESPELYDISILDGSCGGGLVCKGGDVEANKCDDGGICSRGKTGPTNGSSAAGGQ